MDSAVKEALVLSYPLAGFLEPLQGSRRSIAIKEGALHRCTVAVESNESPPLIVGEKLCNWPPGVRFSDVVTAWWLSKAEQLGMELGDQVALVGADDAVTSAARALSVRGLSRMLVLPRECGPSGAIELDLASRLEKWFSEGVGRAFLIGLDVPAAILAQLLRSLPRWGCLALAQSPGGVAPIIPVDLYRDIHKRGISVAGLAPWSAGELDGTKISDWVARSVQLRNHHRVAVAELSESTTSVPAQPCHPAVLKWTCPC